MRTCGLKRTPISILGAKQTMFTLLLLVFKYMLLAVNAETVFFSPPESGLNVTHGCSYEIHWTSDWGAGSNVSLVAWQYADPAWVSQWLLNQIPDPGSFMWTAATVDNGPITEKMHFELCLGACASDSTQLAAIDSGRVYVDGADSICPVTSSTSTTSTDPTSSASTVATTSTSSSHPTTTSSPAETAPSSGDSLEHVTDVSTIVGTVLGAFGFIVAVITLWIAWKTGKTSKAKALIQSHFGSRKGQPELKEGHKSGNGDAQGSSSPSESP